MGSPWCPGSIFTSEIRCSCGGLLMQRWSKRLIASMSALFLLYPCRPYIFLRHNRFHLDCLQIMWTMQPANTLDRAYHNLRQFSFNTLPQLGEGRNYQEKNVLQQVPLFDWFVWLGQEKNEIWSLSLISKSSGFFGVLIKKVSMTKNFWSIFDDSRFSNFI